MHGRQGSHPRGSWKVLGSMPGEGDDRNGSDCQCHWWQGLLEGLHRDLREDLWWARRHHDGQRIEREAFALPRCLHRRLRCQGHEPCRCRSRGGSLRQGRQSCRVSGSDWSVCRDDEVVSGVMSLFEAPALCGGFFMWSCIWWGRHGIYSAESPDWRIETDA